MNGAVVFLGGWGYPLAKSLRTLMKITDDYNAKIRLWAENPRVVPAPSGPKLPGFKSRRFSSHVEMNEWKRSLLLCLAQSSPSNE